MELGPESGEVVRGGIQGRRKGGEFLGHDLPNRFVIDRVIGMGDDITQADQFDPGGRRCLPDGVLVEATDAPPIFCKRITMAS
jgi:hypothetical protein